LFGLEECAGRIGNPTKKERFIKRELLIKIICIIKKFFVTLQADKRMMDID
jgi:hypothetical protein